MIDIVIDTSQMSEEAARSEAARWNAAYGNNLHEARMSANGQWAVAVVVDDRDGRRVDRWVAW